MVFVLLGQTRDTRITSIFKISSDHIDNLHGSPVLIMGLMKGLAHNQLFNIGYSHEYISFSKYILFILGPAAGITEQHHHTKRYI